MANFQVAIGSWGVKAIERHTEITGILQGPGRSPNPLIWHRYQLRGQSYQQPACPATNCYKVLH